MGRVILGGNLGEPMVSGTFVAWVHGRGGGYSRALVSIDR